MRAAAILGLGVSLKQLVSFQQTSNAAISIGMPEHSSDADAVLIFGGDGTIHHHLPRLVELKLPVLIVPCGSGNDFARSLSLRNVRTALSAWHKSCDGGTNQWQIDLGVVHNPAQGNNHYFCCAAGVGLDGEIARRANAMPRWLRSRGGYALSLLPALASFAPIPMNIAKQNISGSPSANVVAVFANTPFYGGGMKIAPRARLDDGQLDVCVIRKMSKLKLLAAFPSIYFGRHLSISGVEYTQTSRVTLATDTPRDVFADGEYICQTPIEVSVAPKALTVIVP
jgi:diacylglycerol kinase (ATP)